MSEPTGRSLHYLDSLDSVRSAWDSPVKGDACTLAQMETIVALAFGRDLVMQQSSAIDSLAAQTVVADVAQAYERARKTDEDFWRLRPRPVRLHLFRADTFGDAAVAGLSRIRPPDHERGDGDPPPFHSSLYPELHSTDPVRLRDAVDELRRANPAKFAELVGGHRGELFERTWRWFRLARKGEPEWVSPSRPRSNSPGLDARVRALITAVTEPGKAELFEERPVRASIEALRELSAAGGPDAFADRSRVHGAWNWFDTGQTPEQIVGAERIGLVREIIDTLYNQVVVDSIGTASASYTTAIRNGDSAVAETVAQAVALHGAAPDRTGDSVISPLEVQISQDVPADNPMLAPKAATEIYARLLEARADPSWLSRLDRLAGDGLGASERAELSRGTSRRGEPSTRRIRRDETDCGRRRDIRLTTTGGAVGRGRSRCAQVFSGFLRLL